MIVYGTGEGQQIRPPLSDLQLAGDDHVVATYHIPDRAQD